VVPWVVSGAALLLAIVALSMVRRLSRQLNDLTRSYWELRYDYTRLRSRMSRLDPENDGGDLKPPPHQDTPAAPAVSSATVSYVPLSTIRKKDK
jgi:hypothetical protein